MTSQNDFREYQYVRRSVRRQRLMELLDKPMTASQMARVSGMTVKTVCRVIAELRDQGLIRCIAPDVNRCRPYARTVIGERIWSQIAEREPSANDQSLDPSDQATYAAVCHRHRSVVVRGLNQPRRASQIKKWIRSNVPGATISANNIRDVLGTLIQLGVVRRIDDGLDRFPIFALTESGQRFRSLLDQTSVAEPEAVPGEPPGLIQQTFTIVRGEAM